MYHSNPDFLETKMREKKETGGETGGEEKGGKEGGQTKQRKDFGDRKSVV